MKYLVVTLSLIAVAFLSVTCKSTQNADRTDGTPTLMDTLYHNAIVSINDRTFVLEADRLVFRLGRTAFVNSNTNFVSLNGNRAVIQIALPNVPMGGPNGLGGVTVDGFASNIRIREDNRGNTLFSMNVTGSGVSARVDFTLFRGTNQCTAVVSPNFNNNRLTLMGGIYPREFSNVFRGRSL